jgi:membrane-associated protein
VLNSAALAVGSGALALGPSWLDPQTLLHDLGDWALWGTLLIVFAECGLLIGFFLPGDSLLFTVGMLIAQDFIQQPLWLACALLTVVAFAGNAVGYEIGRASGPAIFRRPDSRIFKQKYVDKTVEFFDKHGAGAIVLARFVPIVRTFITVTAGVGRMDRRRYLTFSAIGAVLWATGVTVLGHALGRVGFVRDHIEVLLLAVVAVSVIPIGIEMLRHRLRRGGTGGPRHATAADVQRVVTDADHPEHEAVDRH